MTKTSALLLLLLVLSSFCGVLNCAELNLTEVATKFATPCTTPNDDSGFCIEVNKCRHFANKAITPQHELFEFLKASDCGSKHFKILKVCCGIYGNFEGRLVRTTTERHPLTSNERPPRPPSAIAAEDPLPTDCGLHRIPNPEFLTNRIYGGREAYLGEFPWLVRIMRKSKSGHMQFACSGFLIHERFVLTAAHCVQSKELEVLGPISHVVLGEHDAGSDKDCTYSTYLKKTYCSDEPVVAEVGAPAVYSSYDNQSVNHKNDLAILPLRYKINFTDYIQPLCILSNASDVEMMQLAGWGKTETDDTSDKKLKVDVPRVAYETCRDKYNTLPVAIYRHYHICAGSKEGKDSCSGDSGGPLMVEIGGRWYAEGIVSFGYSCGKEGWPGVYTNVPIYSKWIRDTVARKIVKKDIKVRSRTVRIRGSH